ncbi:M56 family metallopeptidase [Mangrovimonas spongiae]|uniref:Peptidase M56 domain-containing protein n=1 Tax=Mangrovimonas spongiae TaxID=2494697 RepID=A0A3R9MTX8_9FLAO|nr:M56 family metallopeptidase [Mangrovimonas spongiae]RSK40678.1 hypothetical protein EJA19_06790 [Mangrovimonas spongiae]
MEYILKSSAIIILFYLCYKIFLQQETFFESNRWFLLTGLLLAAITPVISIPIYVEYTPINTSNFLITNTATPQTPEQGISLINILTWVYFTGLATLGIKLIFEFKALFTILTKTDKSIKGNYTYITTTANIPPFSFFRWIAYNPTQFNKTELKHIINHEKVHAKQLHSIDVIMAQIATVFLWWNPFIWLYKKEIKQNLEFIADKKAQNSSNCKKSYQMLLVKTSTTNNHQLVMANNFYNSLIKKRIVMLHKSKSNKAKAWKYFLILPALALFLMSFNTKKVYIKKDANLKSHVISSATTNNELSKEKNINKYGESGKDGVIVFNDKTTTDIEVHIITKDFTEADINALKETLEKDGLKVTIKGIKRNSKGEIIAIKIDIESNNANANYSISNNTPIQPIQIKYNTNGDNISIGNANLIEKIVVNKDGNNIKFNTKGDNKKVFIVKTDDDKNIKKKIIELKSNDNNNDDDQEVEIIEVIEKDSPNTDEEKEIIIVKEVNNNKEGNIIWAHENNSSNKNIQIIGGAKAPLYIVDNKEATPEEVEKIAPKKIQSMTVLKGEKATNSYGKKGENGVIIITTK